MTWAQRRIDWQRRLRRVAQQEAVDPEGELCALLRKHVERPDVTQAAVALACQSSKQDISSFLTTGTAPSGLDLEKAPKNRVNLC